MVPEVESLGGLSNESARAFTQRIQPLLMNKCGNVACHGSTNREDNLTGFHLIPVRNGSNSHRLYAERNLAEVMRQIDINEPGHSPLSIVPQGTHAGTSGIFHGTGGNAQLKTLRAWINSVADEKQAEEQALAARPSIASKAKRPVMASSKPPALLDGDDGDYVVPAAAVSKPLQKAVTAHLTEESTPPFRADIQAGLKRVEDEDTAASKSEPKTNYKDPDKPSDDAFDPNAFNRRFHNKRK
jgi:hypothetical protein